jgi:hypothetical protein
MGPVNDCALHVLALIDSVLQDPVQVITHENIALSQDKAPHLLISKIWKELSMFSLIEQETFR